MITITMESGQAGGGPVRTPAVIDPADPALAALRALDLASLEPVEPAHVVRWVEDGQPPGAALTPRPRPARPRWLGADVLELTAAELVAAYRRREVSPVEVVEACLAAVDRLDGALNATISVAAEQAVAAARAVADRMAAGEAVGPLAGVPFGVKDTVDVAGLPTTGGSAIFRDHRPARDAALVGRLRAAGAIPLAKLNTMELNFGEEWNPHHGPVRNPWDLSRYSGGSSAGSGAAVAARLVPVAIGLDTGGSIRNPAASCGVVGVKPTYGRVPRTGAMAVAWSMDAVGPITRTAEDAALVLGVVAGPDAGDPSSSRRPVPDYAGALGVDLAGLRVGVPERWFFDDAVPDVEREVRGAITALEELGARVEAVDLPLVELTSIVSWIVIASEFAAAHEHHAARSAELGPVLAARLAQGGTWSATDYLRAQRARHLMQRGVEGVLRRVDVIVTPAAPTVAARFVGSECVVETPEGPRPRLEVTPRTTQPFSLTGLPAVVVNCGFDGGGLPIGLQVVAPPHRDDLALQVAHAYESTRPRPPRPPLLDG